jgi:hypothetical protein
MTEHFAITKDKGLLPAPDSARTGVDLVQQGEWGPVILRNISEMYVLNPTYTARYKKRFVVSVPRTLLFSTQLIRRQLCGLSSLLRRLPRKIFLAVQCFCTACSFDSSLSLDEYSLERGCLGYACPCLSKAGFAIALFLSVYIHKSLYMEKSIERPQNWYISNVAIRAHDSYFNYDQRYRICCLVASSKWTPNADLFKLTHR